MGRWSKSAAEWLAKQEKSRNFESERFIEDQGLRRALGHEI
jgi:hypothetical protein